MHQKNFFFNLIANYDQLQTAKTELKCYSLMGCSI